MRKVYRVGKEKVVALDDICLEIGEGEMCCIVGASGSGKSTLLNQLAGLEKPTKGRVLIGKHDISAMTEDELADFRQQHLGFIFQSYNLLPSMTAAENVALPLMFKGMGKKQREKLARKELKKMGLLSRANHKPTEMSGGQQQRVGIARAFVAKPKVIFADEPTGNLDSTTSRQVLYSMLEMAKSYGITFVMVTHEKELAYCGDRIVTIKDGRVLDNVLLGEDEKAENRRRLFGDVTSGDIAEPETTVAEEKKPAARQAKAVAAAVAEKVNQESM
nr:ABC transporter ATP-binding protein [Ruthenibacterium lactatiformans]